VPDIHIEREHELGLPEARQLAFRWAELAEEKVEMECNYEEGTSSDLVSFSRPGVNGELEVTATRFVLHARLGFLLGVFKERIETEIVKNLDDLLAQEEPLKALDVAVAAASAKVAAKKAAPRKKA
jgi:putative polyhydroxyalkanoate system protein